MFGKIVLVLSGLAWASGQIPNFGFCPEYVPMADFKMQRFMGIWYEAERYFQLSEVVSRCVMANYTKGIDGKYRVSNHVTNRFTGVKRILEGEIKPAASKAEEGTLQVKYTIPLTPETKYSVLETDYDSYAVLWSCQGIGPVHAQNAWVMTRERIPSGEVLQKAYGVLDKYKISKTFFVKTDQAECVSLDASPLDLTAEELHVKTKQKPQRPVEAHESTRSAIDLQDIEVKREVKAEIPNVEVSPIAEIAKLTLEESAEPAKTVPETVPERILKAAEALKEEESGTKNELEIAETKKENAVETANEEANEHHAAEKAEKTV